MSDLNSLTDEQRDAICRAVGHLSALPWDKWLGPANDRCVRDLVTAFGMDSVRDIDTVAACFDREQVAEAETVAREAVAS